MYLYNMLPLTASKLLFGYTLLAQFLLHVGSSKPNEPSVRIESCKCNATEDLPLTRWQFAISPNPLTISDKVYISIQIRLNNHQSIIQFDPNRLSDVRMILKFSQPLQESFTESDVCHNKSLPLCGICAVMPDLMWLNKTIDFRGALDLLASVRFTTEFWRQIRGQIQLPLKRMKFSVKLLLDDGALLACEEFSIQRQRVKSENESTSQCAIQQSLCSADSVCQIGFPDISYNETLCNCTKVTYGTHCGIFITQHTVNVNGIYRLYKPLCYECLNGYNSTIEKEDYCPCGDQCPLNHQNPCTNDGQLKVIAIAANNSEFTLEWKFSPDYFYTPSAFDVQIELEWIPATITKYILHLPNIPSSCRITARDICENLNKSATETCVANFLSPWKAYLVSITQRVPKYFPYLWVDVLEIGRAVFRPNPSKPLKPANIRLQIANGRRNCTVQFGVSANDCRGLMKLAEMSIDSLSESNEILSNLLSRNFSLKDQGSCPENDTFGLELTDILTELPAHLQLSMRISNTHSWSDWQVVKLKSEKTGGSFPLIILLGSVLLFAILFVVFGFIGLQWYRTKKNAAEAIRVQSLYQSVLTHLGFHIEPPKRLQPPNRQIPTTPRNGQSALEGADDSCNHRPRPPNLSLPQTPPHAETPESHIYTVIHTPSSKSTPKSHSYASLNYKYMFAPRCEALAENVDKPEPELNSCTPDSHQYEEID